MRLVGRCPCQRIQVLQQLTDAEHVAAVSALTSRFVVRQRGEGRLQIKVLCVVDQQCTGSMLLPAGGNSSTAAAQHRPDSGPAGVSAAALHGKQAQQHPVGPVQSHRSLPASVTTARQQHGMRCVCSRLHPRICALPCSEEPAAVTQQVAHLGRPGSCCRSRLTGG